MYIATVPHRGSPPAILLRESYRHAKKVRTRTLANLSQLPPEVISNLRRALRGKTLCSPDEAVRIERSLPPRKRGQEPFVRSTLRTVPAKGS